MISCLFLDICNSDSEHLQFKMNEKRDFIKVLDEQINIYYPFPFEILENFI